MCHIIILLFVQASLSPQNYSNHMMTSLDMLYKEVKYMIEQRSII